MWPKYEDGTPDLSCRAHQSRSVPSQAGDGALQRRAPAPVLTLEHCDGLAEYAAMLCLFAKNMEFRAAYQELTSLAGADLRGAAADLLTPMFCARSS